MALCVDDFLQNFVALKKSNHFDWKKLEDTVLYTTYEAFLFRSYSFYYRMYKNVIDNLIPTGIMNWLLEDDYTKKWKFKKSRKGPKILSFNDLSFGFNIWLCTCLISLLAFGAEQLDRFKLQKPKKIKFAKIYPLEDTNENHFKDISEELIKIFRIVPKSDCVEPAVTEIDEKINLIDLNPAACWKAIDELIDTIDEVDLSTQKSDLENDSINIEDFI